MGYVCLLHQVSFHKYGEFFPGTGALEDIGFGKGGCSRTCMAGCKHITHSHA